MDNNLNILKPIHVNWSLKQSNIFSKCAVYMIYLNNESKESYFFLYPVVL